MKNEERELKEALLQCPIATAADILVKLANAVVGIIVARGFGAEGKGTYSLIIMFIGLASLTGSVGINFAHLYLLSSQRYSLESIARDERIRRCSQKNV